MKKLSKTAILLASVALVLGLVACPNKTEPKPEPGPKPSTEVKVTGVSLNATKVYRENGETFQLTATITPSNATNKAITWSSSDTNIASVSEGLVTFNSNTAWETATITVTTSDGNFQATCEAIIINKPTATPADTNGFVTINAGSMPLDSDGSYHVTITKDFKICDHEVTQKEWQDIMGNNPSYFSSNPATDETHNLRPVENVNWYMAIAYCNKRSIKESLEPCYSVSSVSNWNALTFDKIPTENNDTWNAATCDFTKTGYRLPTEAEWEIAARGGLTGDVYAGTANESELGQYAWYSANSDSKTHEVKKKSPNGYGLYDMSGNVLEWCWDWHGSYASEATDPTGPGSGTRRVNCGGCWDDIAIYCRASDRNYYLPTGYRDCLGLRLVRSAQ